MQFNTYRKQRRISQL